MSIKEKILKALDVFLLVLREKTLQTLEEVDANDGEGYWVGAGTVAELNNKLNQNPEFIYGADGKITGYKTPEGGADTVFPFTNAINGTVLINLAGKGYGSGQLGYGGAPDFAGMFPAGYKYISVEISGTGAYLEVDGTRIASSTSFYFKDSSVPHEWTSSGTYMSSGGGGYKCKVTGHTV